MMIDVVTWETSLEHVCQESDVPVSTSKRKIRVGTTVPAARIKAGRILWIIKESKAVNTCPTSQALSIHTVATIA